MTAAGGASTHYGILYQVLSELAHTFAVDTSGPTKNPTHVTITIEPAGGGGDLVDSTPTLRRVYQYKARADKSTWSMKQLVEGVFPDLLRAVDDSLSPTEYYFVTEGTEGELAELWKLHDELAAVPVPESPLDALDTRQRPFFPKKKLSPKQLFQLIVKQAYKDKQPSAEDLKKRYKKVWSLLANFTFRTEVMDEQQEKVFARLMDVTHAREDVSALADQLYGYLLKLGGKGHQQLSAERLLRAIGVFFVPLSMLRDHPDVRKRLERSFREVRYDGALVIRRSVVWPSDKRLFASAGRSGGGKTTLLAQLADELSASGPVVFITGGKSVQEALKAAADTVWQSILQHDRELSLEAMARRAKDVGVSRADEPWLTIVLDLTAGPDDVRELLRLPLDEWNVRLAFSATSAIDFDPDVTVVHVNDFTAREVRRFLTLRGKSGHLVPDGIVDMLSRPFDASMYAELPANEDWRPENEYVLLDRFWRWIDEAPGPTDRRDAVRLLRLTNTLLNEAKYPWPALDVPDWIDDETSARLERVGWIVRTVEGDVRFRHERLLNWAAAQAMIERVRAEKWTIDELGAVLAESYTRQRTTEQPYLGYAAMNVLWLGASRLKNSELARLLEFLEDADHHVYDDVQTLGMAAMPLLIARLAYLEERYTWRGYAALASLRLLDRRNPLDAATLKEMLSHTSPWLQDIALILLVRRPDASLLERIWSLRNARVYSEDEFAYKVEYDERVSDALTAAARIRPEWLRAKILATSDSQTTAALLDALSGSGTTTGRDLWLDVKLHVLGLEGTDHLNTAIHCIERFNDREEVDRLNVWVRGDAVPAAALRGLAYIAPSNALDFLKTSSLEFVRWYLPEFIRPLMVQMPEGTADGVREAISSGRLESRQLSVAMAAVQRLDEKTFAVLVAGLVDTIAQDPDGELPDKDPISRRAGHFVEALDAVNTVEALMHLRELAKSDAGLSLTRYVVGRLKRSGVNGDLFVRHADHLLFKMGGEPLERLLEAQLAHPARWLRKAIRRVMASPTEALMARVHDLLDGAVNKPGAEPNRGHALRQACIETIAGVEGRVAAIWAIEKSGGSVTDTIVEILAGAPPAPIGITNELIERFRSETTLYRLALLTLAGRGDVLPEVVAIIKTIAPNSDFRSAAADTLAVLVSTETPIEHVLALGLDGRFEAMTLRLLDEIGTDAAVDAIEAHLLGRELGDQRSYYARLAADLVVRNRRTSLAPAILESFQRPSWILWEDVDLYKAIAEVPMEDVEDLLLRRAFGSDGRAPASGAIRGLAVRNPARAFDAALRILRETGKQRWSVVDLLFETVPEKAAVCAIEHIPHERNVLVRRRIGWWLRKVDGGNTIAALLASADAATRGAGCELAGWVDELETTRLRELALTDLDALVRSLAMAALEARNEHRRLHALLAEFETASGSQAWALAQMIIDTGDPFLVTEYGDPLSIGPRLKHHPTGLIQQAQERVNGRWKTFIDRNDEDMRDDFGR